MGFIIRQVRQHFIWPAASSFALDMFNKGEGGFKDRDLYFCANASDGTLTAHPSLRGEHLQDIKPVIGICAQHR